MSTMDQVRVERFEIVLQMLQEIVRQLADLKRHVDEIDRTLRPYGDGRRETRRR